MDRAAEHRRGLREAALRRRSNLRNRPAAVSCVPAGFTTARISHPCQSGLAFAPYRSGECCCQIIVRLRFSEVVPEIQPAFALGPLPVSWSGDFNTGTDRELWLCPEVLNSFPLACGADPCQRGRFPGDLRASGARDEFARSSASPLCKSTWGDQPSSCGVPVQCFIRSPVWQGRAPQFAGTFFTDRFSISRARSRGVMVCPDVT